MGAANAETVADMRIARPRRTLVVPWCISKAKVGWTPEEKEAGKERIANLPKDKDGKLTAEAKDKEAKEHLERAKEAHIVLVVAELRQSADNALGLPSIKLYNSHPQWQTDHSKLWKGFLAQIPLALRNLRWLNGPFSEPAGLLTLLSAIKPEDVQVARQTDGISCGIHTILNGRAYCMGLSEFINTDFRMRKDPERNSALLLIELAMAGDCDF